MNLNDGCSLIRTEQLNLKSLNLWNRQSSKICCCICPGFKIFEALNFKIFKVLRSRIFVGNWNWSNKLKWSPNFVGKWNNKPKKYFDCSSKLRTSKILNRFNAADLQLCRVYKFRLFWWDCLEEQSKCFLGLLFHLPTKTRLHFNLLDQYLFRTKIRLLKTLKSNRNGLSWYSQNFLQNFLQSLG